MATSPKRVYWDACSWIALIQREKIRDDKGIVTEDRDTMCRTVWNAALKDKTVEIVTSTLSLVEVSKTQTKAQPDDAKLADFFEHPHIEVVNLDRLVGERARKLMVAGYSKLRPADATHLATALVANVDEMHTFDQRLIDIDGFELKADGSKLRICKPDAGPSIPLITLQPAPLLEEAEDDEEESVDLTAELAGEYEADDDLPEVSEPEPATEPAVVAKTDGKVAPK